MGSESGSLQIGFADWRREGSELASPLRKGIDQPAADSGLRFWWDAENWNKWTLPWVLDQ